GNGCSRMPLSRSKKSPRHHGDNSKRGKIRLFYSSNGTLAFREWFTITPEKQAKLCLKIESFTNFERSRFNPGLKSPPIRQKRGTEIDAP
ncbi:MAG TPA: hypothetical protein VKS19_05585, partial [Verrucomicrobiae bacterium]|nr:hypothetical protein [Verrucomicrobiae bacterium]